MKEKRERRKDSWKKGNKKDAYNRIMNMRTNQWRMGRRQKGERKGSGKVVLCATGIHGAD